jgi:hypothetical protein
MEGVAQDQGTPGSPAVDAQGNVVNKKRRLDFIEVDAAGAHQQAVFQRMCGNDAIADKLDEIAGQPSKVGFVQRHPIAFGVTVGVAGAAVVTGAVVGGRYLWKRRQLKKQGGAKVIRLK